MRTKQSGSSSQSSVIMSYKQHSWTSSLIRMEDLQQTLGIKIMRKAHKDIKID